MKKILLTLALSTITMACFCQKTFQFRNFGNQALRKSITIQGKLEEKIQGKHFKWFKLSNAADTMYVLLADTSCYRLAKKGEHLVLPESFEIESKDWKRKR